MWDRALLKKNAKVAFTRNYVACVIACLITMVLGGGMANYSININIGEQEQQYTFSSYQDMYNQIEQFMNSITPEMLMAISIGSLLVFVLAIASITFVSNIMTVGCNRYFLENREHQTEIVKIFYSFQGGRYVKTVWKMFLRDLYVWAWSLLLVIPGIIKSYAYIMVPFLLAENPDMEQKRVFELSEEMMRGHKWEAFVLQLSFIGWNLISSISGGLVGVFYVAPYYHATWTEYYSALKAEAQAKGLFAPHELQGAGEPEVI